MGSVDTGLVVQQLDEAFERATGPGRAARDAFTGGYVHALAAAVAGSIVERHPEQENELDRWAADECFRVRRETSKKRPVRRLPRHEREGLAARDRERKR